MNSAMERTCTDVNDCGDDSNRPQEKRACIVSPASSDDEGLGDVTGFSIGNLGLTPPIIGSILVMILIGSLGYYTYRRIYAHA